MTRTLESLRIKGHYIYDTEAEAVLLAILLHDIGHGPFSHTLEYGLLEVVDHEDLSLLIMEQLNKKYRGSLTLAIQIFTGTYHRKFLHELVTSQLDMDRMDYLKRDSYFTGVSEGNIGAERIIQMLNIAEDQLVVEEKGIYSIENFLSSRRLMYWQVYLHKTTISADRILNNIIARVKHLLTNDSKVYVPENLKPFLENDISIKNFREESLYLDHFTRLDDHDIWYSLKIWMECNDPVLADLSTRLLNRELFQISITNEKPSKKTINKLIQVIQKDFKVSKDEAEYYLSTGSITNSAYMAEGKSIRILMKSGEVLDITQAADLPNIKAMSKIVRKFYLCWPKGISL
jgi:HD superfamily phosphohydrolase